MRVLSSIHPGVRLRSRLCMGREDMPRGYGTDTGGGHTAELLDYLRQRFGPISSFSGSYRADRWSLNIIISPGIYIYYLLRGLV